MKRLAILLLCACGFEDLGQLQAESECVVEGRYLAQIEPIHDDCGDARELIWLTQRYPIPDCVGLMRMPDGDQASIVCEPGVPTVYCLAVYISDSCPYQAVLTYR